MEAVPEQVVVVEEVKSSEGNPFILFILFVLILAIHYIIPLIGTLYAQKSARKWIAYWVTLLLINSVLHPLLAFCLGASGATFLNLVLGALVLYVVSDEKADLLVETGDIGIQVATQQYNNLKERGLSLLRQYGLVA